MRLSILLVCILALAGCLSENPASPKKNDSPAGSTSVVDIPGADSVNSSALHTASWTSAGQAGNGALLFELNTEPDNLCTISMQAHGSPSDSAISFWAGSDLAPTLDMEARGYAVSIGAMGVNATPGGTPWEVDAEVERPVRNDGRFAVLLASPGIEHPAAFAGRCEGRFNWTAWQATDEVFLFGGSEMGEGFGVSGAAGVVQGTWSGTLVSERVAVRVAHGGGGGGTATIHVVGPLFDEEISLGEERGMWAWEGGPGEYRLDLRQQMPDEDPLTIMVLGLRDTVAGNSLQA